MNLYLNKWCRLSQVSIFRQGWRTFVVFPGKQQERVQVFLKDFSAGNTVQTAVMKDSPTTKAGISLLPGTDIPIFWKRNNNKGLSFTLRYLFRPARVFRAASAAERFHAIGIATPRVLAAGE